MLRHTIELPPTVRDVPFTPLSEYDPAAVEFLERAFVEHAAQAGQSGEGANWERRELVTVTGLFVARVLDRDTIIHDKRYPNGGTAHSEEFEISDRVALGTLVYSGGIDPNTYDWEDDGHNGDLIFAFEARMPDGSEAAQSVRIGLRQEAIGGLAVVSGSMLSSIDPELRPFDPLSYRHATPDPLQHE